MQQQSDLICCVCEGRATGIHYEVVSCEACKSFFRRSVVLEARYSCRRRGDCVIKPAHEDIVQALSTEQVHRCGHEARR